MIDFVEQADAMDCGPACLSMIASYYGKKYDLKNLRKDSFLGKDGVSLLGISKAAEKIGFKTVGGMLVFDSFLTKSILPCYSSLGSRSFCCCV